MLRIEIAYDPYHMRTRLQINGTDVLKAAKGYEKFQKVLGDEDSQIPLQSWLDPIEFQEWRGLLPEAVGNSMEREVEVHFIGRRVDFEDLKISLEQQREKNLKYPVQLSFPNPQFVYDDLDVMKSVEMAYNWIQSDEFRAILDDKLFHIEEGSSLRNAYNCLAEKYEEALNGEFRIVFAGMYSSGKSTLINAILGKEILPTSDETCTSKVFRIEHDERTSFARMWCTDANNNIVVPENEYDENTLSEAFETMFPRGSDGKLLPSVPAEIETVHIATNMCNLYPRSGAYNKDSIKLVIIDTPGTNSGDGKEQKHLDITKNVIQSGKQEIVIFVTSASQNKVDSIMQFLDIVDQSGNASGAYDQRFLFALNMADTCVFKGKETWESKLKSTQTYYCGGNKQRRIQNPRFFPTSARAALAVRTGDTEDSSIYDSIRSKYFRLDLDTFKISRASGEQAYHFDEYCSTSQKIKDSIQESILEINQSKIKNTEKYAQEILYHSGVVSLEMAIQDYVERYAVPLKIQSLLSLYEIIFHETEQLVRIAEKRFNEVAGAANAAADEKNYIEQEKERQFRRNQSLNDAQEKLDIFLGKMREITDGFKLSSEEKSGDIKQKMYSTICKAKSYAEKNKNETDVILGVKRIIDGASEECQKAASALLEDSNKKVDRLEENVRFFLKDIQNLIDFGDNFSVKHSTAFQRADITSLEQIVHIRRTIRNPELDRGFFLFRPFKRMFLDKTITVDDGIDVNDLDAKLQMLTTDFNKNVDKFIEDRSRCLEDAAKSLSIMLRQLLKEIKQQKEQLDALEDNIKKVSTNYAQQKKLVDEFEKYKLCLKAIRKNTELIDATILK